MENVENNYMLSRAVFFIRKARDVIVLAVLFCLYHLYDVFCYYVSNVCALFPALCIMLAVLFLAAVLLVFLHQIVGEKFGWDVLGLSEFNALKGADIQRRNIWKRFERWVMRRTWTIYWIGSIIFGPHVVALLLRRNKRWLP